MAIEVQTFGPDGNNQWHSTVAASAARSVDSPFDLDVGDPKRYALPESGGVRVLPERSDRTATVPLELGSEPGESVTLDEDRTYHVMLPERVCPSPDARAKTADK